MKLGSAVSLIAILLISAPTLAKQEVLVYGDINYPPYSFEEDGKPKGIYVDILKAAFAHMPDYDVTIKMIPWKRGLEYIRKQSKEIGKIAGEYAK